MKNTTLIVCVGMGLVALLLLSSEGAEKKDAGATTETTAKEGPQLETPPEEEQAAHHALIALRDRILKNHDAGDIQGVLDELDDHVVVTFQDGTVCRGPKDVQAYYEEKIGRPDSVVKEVKSVCVIDRWSQLYNDQNVAVVGGRLEQDFSLRDGKQFQLVSPWTASLVKQGDDWKITGFHVSTNMFDNGVLNLFIQQNRLWTGVIAGASGLIVGLVMGILFSGRRPKEAIKTGSV